MAIHLSTPVKDLPGIGPTAAKDLARLDVKTVRDLLWYFPFRYDDFSVTKPIPLLRHDDTVTVVGAVREIASRRSKNGRVMLTEAVVENDTGELKVTWFNQPFLEKVLRPGTRVALAGRIDRKFGGTTMVSPIHEPPEARVHTGRIVPVYGLTGTLAQRRVRNALDAAMEAIDELVDWLPEDIRDAETFFDLPTAVRTVHFPESNDHLSEAIARLKFDELFLHQLMFAQVRRERAAKRAYAIPLDLERVRGFVSALPFKLTHAQRRAAWEIVQDLGKDEPMNRLLQGDVGSGKTVVAALAARAVVSNGMQVVYLAPTEILAEQQERTFLALLPDASVSLLTNAHARVGGEEIDRERLLAELRSGEIKAVIGTHALLEEAVRFKNAALVVIDEQQRFGVEQRHAILERAGEVVPHLLSMTATPIPRSLALTLYGDLELSIIDERPAGRKPIATKLVVPGQEKAMEKFLVDEVARGGQAFVVCPLIDPSDKLGAKSVTEVAKRFSKSLKGCRVAMLHGQMKSAEKDGVMSAFARHEFDVLVSTTVIEVGVDVPNATVMVIIGAEHFGLSQLHQLRGRVGRSDKPSYCFLCPENLTDVARSRLGALVASQNGFVIAEKDLELRGGGNLFGNAQSGFPDFRFATATDTPVIKKARDRASTLIERDPHLERYPLLRERITAAFDEAHLE